MTVRDAFRRYAGIDLYDSLSTTAQADAGMLAQQARDSGIRVAPDDDWSDIFSRVLAERVEPNLRCRATYCPIFLSSKRGSACSGKH